MVPEMGQPNYHLRILIQFLGHYEKKSLPEAEIAGMKALYAHSENQLDIKSSNLEKAKMAEYNLWLCEIAQIVTDTSLKTEEIREMLCKVSKEPLILLFLFPNQDILS